MGFRGFCGGLGLRVLCVGFLVSGFGVDELGLGL